MMTSTPSPRSSLTDVLLAISNSSEASVSSAACWGLGIGIFLGRMEPDEADKIFNELCSIWAGRTKEISPELRERRIIELAAQLLREKRSETDADS